MIWYGTGTLVWYTPSGITIMAYGSKRMDQSAHIIAAYPGVDNCPDLADLPQLWKNAPASGGSSGKMHTDNERMDTNNDRIAKLDQ